LQLLASIKRQYHGANEVVWSIVCSDTFMDLHFPFAAYTSFGTCRKKVRSLSSRYTYKTVFTVVLVATWKPTPRWEVLSKRGP